jgi:hypothetical protein
MCFSWDFIKQCLIFLVVICAIIAILKLIVPYVVSQMGITLGAGWNVIVQVIRIFIWALIAIFIIIFCFEIIACLWSYTGGVPLLHRG